MALLRGRAAGGAARADRKKAGRVVFIYLPFAALVIFGIATTTGSLHLSSSSSKPAQGHPQVIASNSPEVLQVGAGFDDSFALEDHAPEYEIKYLKMQLNEGRLNNQLRSLDGAMRWAKALNRTLFLQDPCLAVTKETTDYTRMVSCRNQWLGLDEGLWDLEQVRAKFDFLLEADVMRMWGSTDKHPTLGKEPGPGCSIGVDNLPEKGPKLEHCKLLYVGCGGVFPWVAGTTEKHGVPRLSFLEAMRPAPPPPGPPPHRASAHLRGEHPVPDQGLGGAAAAGEGALL